MINILIVNYLCFYFIKYTDKTPSFLKRYRHLGLIRCTPGFSRRTAELHR